MGTSLRVALIARCDNSGLGTLSWEFARHLRPDKVLLVENGVFQTFPERYKNFKTRRVPARGSIAPELMQWLLTDIDVVLSIETFYNWELVSEARRNGVKTALVTMFEMSRESLPIKPDLFICPSTLDFKAMPDPKVYLPIPLATDRLEWRQRTKAQHFIHTASHGGMNLRKGTPHIIEAMKYVESDIDVTIYSWIPFHADDPRVKVKRVLFENYWQVWREGDALIYPQDYNGICLPVSEAFASGLGLVTTNIPPFNEWLPKECLFSPAGFYKTRAATGLIEVDAAKIDPRVLARKIDEVAASDLSSVSLAGKRYAEENSWDILLPRYLKVLEDLCKK